MVAKHLLYTAEFEHRRRTVTTSFEHSRRVVRSAHPTAYVRTTTGGTMYMVEAKGMLLSGPKVSPAHAWIEAARVVRSNSEPAGGPKPPPSSRETRAVGKLTLRAELAETEARAEALRRRIAAETCVTAGHDWKHLGGRDAGCGDLCRCSVPVYVCTLCGDSDYGDNSEADETRARCAALQQQAAEPAKKPPG